MKGSAVTFAVLTAFVSASNDVITKFVSHSIPTEQVTFLRFFFSLATLIPFLKKEHILSLKLQWKLQISRGVIGALAIGLFIYSLKELLLPEVTILSLTQTLFFLPISALFLKEKVEKRLILATLIGFMGVLVFFLAPMSFKPSCVILLCSSLLFAVLDMMAKRLVHRQSFFTMLWHFSFVTTCISAPFAWFAWTNIGWADTLLLFILGAGANVIQITLFSALARAPANHVSPFRYLEVVFSCLAGWLLFHEALSVHMAIGATIIIGATHYIAMKK